MTSPSPISTPDPSVFLDANIVLEVLLGRGNDAVARKYLETHAGSLHISTLTAHLVVHFGHKIVELPVLRQFLADYTVLPLEEADFEWAFTNARTPDFEDALQLGVAIRHGCSRFITFDESLYKAYKDFPTITVQLARPQHYDR